MKKRLDFSQLQDSLKTAQDILLALPSESNFDRVAAGLAFYLALKKTKKESRLPAGRVSIFCAKPMTVEFSSLIGVNQVGQKPQGKNLTISFDYIEGAIEKVSYNIENNKFNLLIQPKKGSPSLSTENIRYHYSGEQPNLIFTLGARGLPDLGEIYFQNKKLFEQTPIVNLDISSQNQRFGKINLVDSQASCFSELVVLMLSDLNLAVDGDVASNLLTGLQMATANFSLAKASASAFEAAAFCLRAGAKQPRPRTPLESMPAQISAKKPPAPSPDWLEPKIYKGNTLI